MHSWNELTEFIKRLPYGRNKNRTDVGLVLSENKGSCSSKHAFLKRIADLNNIPNVKLVLGLYRMNNTNTPGIGDTLERNSLNYIPEAHCYLIVEDKRTDVTTSDSEFARIEKDIILEKEIEPEQVDSFKVEYHKTFMRTWIEQQKLDFSFDEIWTIREQCIENLSE
ncbi:MAG: hypothetical protein COA58_02840 [Bacteroidetes bacterium]|nr:MAG: hypothetical protein COA58_02840 [Bacteroidota bacterium]